ncbi:ABC transporter ATP-binding protein [Euzebya sp.]|uniref:ABC transporter ATP-binding protein n=1 Tax=Euzebya sp. TaxID=1971409 RepID=UPI0035125DBC
MDADVVIRTEGLVKDYRTVRALDGLDLEVRRGEVFGFLGPNGAGKSTTIRILLDLLRPTSGTVEVLGVAPAAGGPALRARIGYLPGELVTQGRRTAGELLGHLAALRGGRGADRIGPLAARFGLDLERPIRGLSKGNKQKVGVVQAFMHTPELLILDEPTSGLDPLLQREFLDLVGEARDGGATVLMSSHVLSEIEEVAGRVAIIREGRIVDVDDVAVLRQRAGQHVVLRFADPVEVGEFATVDGVEDPAVEGTTLTCRLHGPPDPLLKVAARHRVMAWSAADRDLEDLFLDFYRLPPTDAAEEATTDVR